MKRPALLGMIVVGMLSAFAGGCSGGGGNNNPLTVNQYVQRILTIDQEHETRAAPFRAKLESFSSLAEDAAVPAEALTAFQGLLKEEGTFLAAIKKVKPPAEAEALQQEAIDALKAERDTLQGALDQVNEETTVGELNQLFQADTVARAVQRRTSACLALQKFASDSGIEVDLTC